MNAQYGGTYVHFRLILLLMSQQTSFVSPSSWLTPSLQRKTPLEKLWDPQISSAAQEKELSNLNRDKCENEHMCQMDHCSLMMNDACAHTAYLATCNCCTGTSIRAWKSQSAQWDHLLSPQSATESSQYKLGTRKHIRIAEKGVYWRDFRPTEIGLLHQNLWNIFRSLVWWRCAHLCKTQVDSKEVR